MLAAAPPYDDIVALARRAPSYHNTQPWLWRVEGDHLDLVADESRRLPHGDPDGRSLVLSCGAALHHLQVAAVGLGWSAMVLRLPEPDDPRLLARVRLTPGLPSSADSRLLHCLTVRHTDRRPFAPGRVSPGRLQELVTVGERWGSLVVPVADRRQRDLLRDLATQADHRQRSDPAYVDELAAWTRFRRGDGVPASSRTDRTEVAHGLPDRFRTSASGGRDDEGALMVEAPASGTTDPALLLVTTSSDDRLSRLRAGETMSALWLEATRQGLSLVPVNQCLEVADARRAVTEQVLGNRLCPQALLVVGRVPSHYPALPRTRRRPVEDVMVHG